MTPLTRFLVIILNIAQLQQQVELLQQTFSETFLLFPLSPSQGDDDEDAPMISGFSDDVPMVIA